MDNMPMVQPSACRMCQVKNSKLAAKDAEIARLKEELKRILSICRENGIGANSPDAEDAVRQAVQVAIVESDNAKILTAQLAEAQGIIAGLNDALQGRVRPIEDIRAELDAARKGAQE